MLCCKINCFATTTATKSVIAFGYSVGAMGSSGDDCDAGFVNCRMGSGLGLGCLRRPRWSACWRLRFYMNFGASKLRRKCPDGHLRLTGCKNSVASIDYLDYRFLASERLARSTN